MTQMRTFAYRADEHCFHYRIPHRCYGVTMETQSQSPMLRFKPQSHEKRQHQQSISYLYNTKFAFGGKIKMYEYFLLVIHDVAKEKKV